MNTYDDLTKERTDLEHGITQLEDEHRKVMSRMRSRLGEVQRAIDIANSGVLSAEDLVVAESLLEVRWFCRQEEPYHITNEVLACFDGAVRDIEDGFPRLRRAYFGVKAYDQWDSQRSDHLYGYGPTHGHIWFRIGLRSTATRVEDVQAEARQQCVRYLQQVQARPSLFLGEK